MLLRERRGEHRHRAWWRGGRGGGDLLPCELSRTYRRFFIPQPGAGETARPSETARPRETAVPALGRFFGRCLRWRAVLLKERRGEHRHRAWWKGWWEGEGGGLSYPTVNPTVRSSRTPPIPFQLGISFSSFFQSSAATSPRATLGQPSGRFGRSRRSAGCADGRRCDAEAGA